MSLRFHEISEARNRILNPFNAAKLELLGDIAYEGRDGDVSQLDLCCGKGEMMFLWAQRYALEGTGVDISQVFLSEAEERSSLLGLDDCISFVHDESARYVRGCSDVFDLVSCIGATWIGGGLVGTLELLSPRLRDEGSMLLIGEPFWREPPPAEVEAKAGAPELFVSLEGTLERIEVCGFELVEMVLADEDDWDRYVAAQWQTVRAWLRENADDPEADALHEWIATSRREYMAHQRRYLGWGVFVLQPATHATQPEEEDG